VTGGERLGGVGLGRLRAFRAAEEQRYAAVRPKSAELARQSAETLVGGVPMQWMTDWPLPFPMFIDHAEGASLTDVDGHRYADFCLGDTGSMFGHAAPAVAAAVQGQATRGFTHMLPTVDAPVVGRLLSEVFGLPAWQMALTATDANRFALRVARAITGRPRILVFNGCYHGTVEEAFVHLRNGEPHTRSGMLGQFRDVTQDAAVVEFNDLPALERELARGDIACVVTEPVLTNSAMVLPEPGFHQSLRQLTHDAGTLLLIDETHTLSSGYGGYTRVHGLEPDIWVCGKAIAGGVPTAVWGMTRPVAERFAVALAAKEPGHSGMGTTLAGNALSLAALRANLEQVLTRDNYAHMDGLAERLAGGLSKLIGKAGLPWHIARVGARIEFVLAPAPLRNGTEAAAAHLTEVEQALHIGLLNRGVLIAPFHNMMLVSPATVEADCQAMLAATSEVVEALTR
jgi:glutamate-1-semialdehyde 2,1-aminomutase